MHNATSNSDLFFFPVVFFERENLLEHVFNQLFFSHMHDGHICGSLVLIVTQRHFSSANLQSY